MKIIRKRDAIYLREHGFEEYIKKSYSKNPKYYLVENEKVLNYYNNYRNEIKCK